MKLLLENFKKNMEERFRGPTDDPSFFLIQVRMNQRVIQSLLIKSTISLMLLPMVKNSSYQTVKYYLMKTLAMAMVNILRAVMYLHTPRK